MCGIAGIVAPNAVRYKDALNRMVAALRHRGPDENGIVLFDDCALGHSRLSIVDMHTGSQPMVKEQQRLAITFNGEIYGYRELRAQLSSYPFCTASDTEVILALYEKFGMEMMAYLPGMFSFAIWNDNERELFCARDRFGEKPFFYAIGKHGELILASEIKAILASRLIEPVLSRASLAHYLRRGYVHPTRTIYENIHTLPPAHTLRYKHGQIAVSRYWSFPERNLRLSFADAVEQFRYLLTKAVERQLIADIEVGVLLSGGMDSSTVVSVAARTVPQLKTYSFGYRGRSELPYARVVAERYGTQHTELLEESHDVGQLLVQMQEVFDEPFFDSATIPTYLICKLARRYGKAVLSGDGADELLGGYYWWYLPCLRMAWLNSTPGWALPWIRAIASSQELGRRLLGNDSKRDALRREYKHKWDDALYRQEYSTILDLHRMQTSVVSEQDLARLGMATYRDDAAAAVRAWEASNTPDDALKMDLDDYLAGDILVKTDRASMAHGLEIRAPFLDAELASFCLSLPLRFKVSTRADKLILKEAFSNQWPALIGTRSKQGFGAPLDEWMRQPSVRSLKQDFLEDPRRKLFQLVPFEDTQRFVRENSSRMWLLLVLSLWLETHSAKLSRS